MKSGLALLAVPFFALACRDAEQATPLEPPAISADVTTQAAPLPTPLVITCVYSGGGNAGQACDQDASGNFYDKGANDNNLVLGWSVAPAAKGTVTHHRCLGGGLLQPASSCVNHEGGKWGFRTKRDVPPATGQLAVTGTGLAHIAFRVKYTAKGSGFKNGTVIFTAFSTQLAP